MGDGGTNTNPDKQAYLIAVDLNKTQNLNRPVSHHQ